MLRLSDVIEIGKAQGMCEFMASGADSRRLFTRVSPQFGRAEIAPEKLSSHLAEISGLLVWPNGPGLSSLGLIVPRVIEEDHVDGTIIVGIILIDVNLAGHHCICFHDGFVLLAIIIVGRRMA